MGREKWALVTGAASGIGRETARLLADEGARLVLVDRDAPALERVATELRGRAASVHPFVVDVSDRGAMERLAADVERVTEALDLLVNNAGILVTGGFDDSSLEDWERVVGVNLLGPVYGSKLFVPAMKKRGRGAVVNVASASGLVGFPTIVAYATTKSGLVGLTLSMRGELRRSGVSVNAVCPGLVRTDIGEHANLPPEELRAVRSLLERHGADPRVVARAILRAAERDSGVVALGWQGRLFDWLGRVARNAAPGWIASLARRPDLGTRRVDG